MLVAVAFLRLTNIALHLVAQRLTTRQKHRHTSRQVFAQDEELELASQFAVIAFLRLFQAPQVLFELLFREPRRAVQPLQHGSIFVSAPIGTRYAHQLERAYLTCIGHVRAAAEVKKIVLLEDTYLRVGQVFDQLNLVDLTLITKVL